VWHSANGQQHLHVCTTFSYYLYYCWLHQCEPADSEFIDFTYRYGTIHASHMCCDVSFTNQWCCNCPPMYCQRLWAQYVNPSSQWAWKKLNLNKSECRQLEIDISPVNCGNYVLHKVRGVSGGLGSKIWSCVEDLFLAHLLGQILYISLEQIWKTELLSEQQKDLRSCKSICHTIRFGAKFIVCQRICVDGRPSRPFYLYMAISVWQPSLSFDI
jgi:hypothetical protein